MEGTTAASPRATGGAVDAPTMLEAFWRTAARCPDRVAVRMRHDEVSLTWGELRRRADALAGGLARLGVGRGDTVAIMLSNRPEFHLADLAAMTLGATPFSLYQTLSPEQIAYVLSDAGARVAILERAHVDQLRAARRELPELEHLIVVDGPGGDGLLALAQVEGSDPDFDAAAAAAGVTPDDLLTLIYTSGTTGPPKGVELTHRNLMSTMAGLHELIEFPEQTRVISWLPAAHIAERAAHHYLPIVFGFTVTSCPNPREIVAFLPEVRPNWFFAVPRIWEKLKAGLEAMIAGQPDEQREAAQRALAASLQRVRLRQARQRVPDELEAAVARADDELFAKLRVQLGLDQVVTVNVGAAPTPRDVLEFFHAIGIELAELWGMSETCGAGAVNPVGKIKIGTVGLPAPGFEIRLADDGELLVRSDAVMLGYRNQPEKTAEALDADGWLHTGDVGELDPDGYLKIIDRKKELIISAAGKNMSPANIESTLKGSSALIGQACAIGDARPYNTALIVLDADFAPLWAAQHGLGEKTLAELATEPAMIAAVGEQVDTANAKLSRVEQVKRFHVVRGDWAPGGDELTQTMKLKRKPIAQKYAGAIEALYAD